MMHSEFGCFEDHIFPKGEVIDWTDFHSWSKVGKAILDRISADPRLLTALVENVSKDEGLFGMSESHTPFDKLVLFNSDIHGVRIRMHIWRETAVERAHQHRFSFVTKVLHGTYDHVLYKADKGDFIPADAHNARLLDDATRADHASSGLLREIVPVMMTTVKKGDSYALDHSAIHATFPEAGSVSLLIRGPAEKAHAMVADLTQQKVYWRFGRRHERGERIAAKKMTTASYSQALSHLRRIGLISGERQAIGSRK